MPCPAQTPLSCSNTTPLRLSAAINPTWPKPRAATTLKSGCGRCGPTRTSSGTRERTERLGSCSLLAPAALLLLACVHACSRACLLALALALTLALDSLQCVHVACLQGDAAGRSAGANVLRRPPPTGALLCHAGTLVGMRPSIVFATCSGRWATLASAGKLRGSRRGLQLCPGLASCPPLALIAAPPNALPLPAAGGATAARAGRRCRSSTLLRGAWRRRWTATGEAAGEGAGQLELEGRAVRLQRRSRRHSPVALVRRRCSPPLPIITSLQERVLSQPAAQPGQHQPRALGLGLRGLSPLAWRGRRGRWQQPSTHLT